MTVSCYGVLEIVGVILLDHNNVNNVNIQICTTKLYGRNFSDAGGRLDWCSVKA